MNFYNPYRIFTPMHTAAHIWSVLATVPDPEIPAVTVVDMGMITKLNITEATVAVTMTPTFVGCPAIDVIKKDISTALSVAGIQPHEVLVDLETPWNSNRITDEGRQKLEDFGLAPPAKVSGDVSKADLDKVRCPQCGSTDTTLNSPFGSTLCRAIRFCYSCKQGFEQFKPLS